MFSSGCSLTHEVSSSLKDHPDPFCKRADSFTFTVHKRDGRGEKVEEERKNAVK